MDMTEKERELRDRLTVFLYLLMRDHLPFGAIAGVVADIEGKSGFDLTAKGAGFYAQTLAERLMKEKSE